LVCPINHLRFCFKPIFTARYHLLPDLVPLDLAPNQSFDGPT
jgi:hypothetical protein